MIDTTYMTAQEIKDMQIHAKCDHCDCMAPEQQLDENRIDGYKLCDDCFEEYANTPEL